MNTVRTETIGPEKTIFLIVVKCIKYDIEHKTTHLNIRVVMHNWEI